MQKLSTKKLNNGNYCFANEQGENAFTTEFKGISKFNAGFNGLAVVLFLNGKYGFINQKGENAFNSQYKEIGAFYGNIVRVQFADDSYGFINNKGENVFGIKFKHADDFEDGLAKVEHFDGSCRFMNVRGEVAFARSKSVNGNWYLEKNIIKVRLPNGKNAEFNPVTGILDEESEE